MWSTTKAMTALCVHILMDRGELNPEAGIGFRVRDEPDGRGLVHDPRKMALLDAVYTPGGRTLKPDVLPVLRRHQP